MFVDNRVPASPVMQYWAALAKVADRQRGKSFRCPFDLSDIIAGMAARLDVNDFVAGAAERRVRTLRLSLILQFPA
jgi:hypothetical protein